MTFLGKTALCRVLLTASLVMTAAFTACKKGGMLAKVEPHSAPASVANAPIILFNGTGTSPNDVAAIESILKRSTTCTILPSIPHS